MQVVGVTAGASTPHWVIRNVVEQLRDFEEMRKPAFERFLLHLTRFIVYSQIYLTLGAAGLALVIQVASPSQ